jgi:thioredoxin-dependent peroxiredoxin
MLPIKVGDAAPEVAFNVHDGGRMTLSDFKGRVVVLFFYPRDHSPICTQEVCSFRDSFSDFQRAGAAVIGVSGDSQTSHGEFAAGNQLPYLLASDPDGAVRRAFGVRKRLGLLPGRVTYVIDREGIVRNVFQSQFFARKHVDNALRIVQQLELGHNSLP